MKSKITSFFSPVISIGIFIGFGNSLPAQTFGLNGMVVSDHSLESEVGIVILKNGGNEIDGTEATGFFLAFTHSEAGNIGGSGLLVLMKSDVEVTTLDFREKAPLAASPTLFVDEPGKIRNDSNHKGLLSGEVKGTVAVGAKPVINWTSFMLHADNPAFFFKYWFEKILWEDQENYWKRSLLPMVGNVKTPTLLLTGEKDFQTPISKSEQYYAVLKLQGVESAMVRIPNASNGLVGRPSILMSKTASNLS
ncbi:MAG: prolyl oligopeptidase family serine peptidase [Algoriphagus sp.]|nr:prolyl oligopeptidase family serine peptidase [Algoriphagus sp.]